MLKNIILLILSVFILTDVVAQTGGNGVFRFLNLPNSAKVAALGGAFPLSDDISFTETFKNPSLTYKEHEGLIALNYSNYVSDINFGSLQYGLKVKNQQFSTGLMFINYGNFEETDATGAFTGNTFSAGDYLLNVGYGSNYKQKLYYGANAKVIYGSYESYNSIALATDFSFSYLDTLRSLSLGLALNNIGYQIKPFNQIREHLPFSVSVALSKKLKYAPFRYHLTYDNVQNFKSMNIKDKVEIDLITGESANNKPSFLNQFAQHLIVGSELVLSSAFNLQAAYNFKRSKELSISGTSGLSGLSFGLSLKLQKFEFSYAHSTLNAAGSNNYFSLQLQPSLFKSKK